uniref:Immunoglobulin subtype domain-containing protein n=1 Tax=Oryzias sinensis TaxID=183150 RepID=A0A8C7XGB4_9TELE
MLISFYLLLVFGTECCANDLFYETKALKVGDHVNIWMRIVSDNPPENLTENKTPNVKVNLEPGSLELKIAKAKLNDTALYICMRKKYGTLLSFNVTYLRVEASPSTPSIPVCPRDSLTLQCSVLHKSLRNPCPSNESAFCFSLDFSEPDPNNTENNRANEEDNTSKGTVVTKCASFSNYFISSDGWTYYCAVPKCKEKTPVETSQVNTGVVIKYLTAALFVSHIIIVFLIYLVKKLKKELNALLMVSCQKLF